MNKKDREIMVRIIEDYTLCETRYMAEKCLDEILKYIQNKFLLVDKETIEKLKMNKIYLC